VNANLESKARASAEPNPPASEPLLTAESTALSQELQRLGSSEQACAEQVAQGLAAAQCLSEMKAPKEATLAALYAPSLQVPGFETQPLLELAGLPPNEVAEVTAILDGVRQLSEVAWDRIDRVDAQNVRNLFLAMARDIRVVLVALALRITLMRGLKESSLPPETKLKLARETSEIFAPLANRLGIGQFKWELEDHSLRVLEPDSYNAITTLLAERREQREQFIKQALGKLQQRLSEEGLSFSISGRPKHISSIYRKMVQKQVSFDELHDISALRVITERVGDCYTVLGVVHDLWTPIPGEFDDYIAMPKSNGYQSLHTVVIGPEGRPVEVQIRTQAMHHFAELGVAAHWAYKERHKASPAENERLLLLRRLLDWEQESDDPKRFVQSLKTNLFEDQVYVFTPKGEVVDLPNGSTPVDFAYRVHTMVGHRCRGARVNGQIATLNTKLKTGDRVEIFTQKQPKPNRDWMNPSLGFAASRSTRAKVRHWFREQSRESAITEGRELVQRELQRTGVHNIPLLNVAAALGFASEDELFAAVGHGRKRPQAVSAAALGLEPKEPKEVAVPAAPSAVASHPVKAARGLTLHGIADVQAKPGACCHPVPGDEVVGFVTRGRGVVIHRRDCAELQRSPEPERIVAIDWHSERDERLPVEIEVQAVDSNHLIGELTSKTASLGAKVISAGASAMGDGSAVVRMTVECKDTDQLAALLSRLGREPDVLAVRRLHAPN
jgi:RelA/SpoT family (p)ppGpp synthetase